jgi:hypothetical protein
MLNLEQIQLFSQKKHGKAVILGVLAILITALTLAMVSLVSSMPKASSESSDTKYSSNSSDDQDGKNALQSKNAEEYDRYGEISSKFSAKSTTKECDNRFPTNGYKKIFRTDWASSNSYKSEFQIDNKTGKPLWVKLIHPDSHFQIVAFIVYPFESITQVINIGRYGVEFTTGTQWCNSVTGITEGKTLALAKELVLPKTSSVLLRIMSDNDDHLDAIMTNLPRIPTGSENAPMVVEK